MTQRRVGLMVAGAVALAVVTVGRAAPVTADDVNWGVVVPGEYIVTLGPFADAAAVSVAAGARAPIDELSTGDRHLRLTLDPATEPAAVLAALLAIDGVVAAQPNLTVSTVEPLGLRKRFFADLPNPTAASATDFRIDQPALSTAEVPVGPDATGITVAVLDTGIDANHAALSGRVAPGGIDLVDGDLDPAEVANGIDENGNGVADESFGHGTFVAGLVALVAPGVSILPIRVLDTEGDGTTWNVMQGLAWAAARGANVVNASLGGAVPSPLLDSVVERLESNGVIVVAAAGNHAAATPLHPAASPTVVGVAAIDGRTGQAATFTAFGSWVRVAAPGVDVTSLAPGGRYVTWGGTSAAAPIVSATLALVAAQMPGAAADDLVDALTSTARPDGLGGVSSYGRIDVSAAVARAASR